MFKTFKAQRSNFAQHVFCVMAADEHRLDNGFSIKHHILSRLTGNAIVATNAKPFPIIWRYKIPGGVEMTGIVHYKIPFWFIGDIDTHYLYKIYTK